MKSMPLKSRRALVGTTVGTCLLLAVHPLRPLHWLGIAAAVLLAAQDIALIQATRGLAFSRGSRLDERQHALRDRAYRLGFRILGLAIVVLGFVVPVASDLVVAGPWPSQLDNGIVGRSLVVILELLFIMPTFVVAWVEPAVVDAERDHATVRPNLSRRRRSLEWLALPAGLALWLAAVSFAPTQAAAGSHFSSADTGFTMEGATCAHFVSGRVIGDGFGATVGMRAEVCWDGRSAFVFGDPTVPVPPGKGSDYGGVTPSLPDLTSCGADNVDDFSLITDTTCSAITDNAGTLHYTVRARLAPLPFSVGARDVELHLVVTRDGKVLEQP